MRRLAKIAAIGALFSDLFASAARAQDYGGQAAMDLGSAMLDHVVSTATLNPNYRPGANKAGAKAAGVARPANLAYTPSAALKASTVQGYVTRLKTKNPAAAQAVATNFGPGKYDYGQIYRGLTKDSGLRENDAADNLSSFMILGWMVVNNVQDGNAITVPMARGVRDQLAPKLAQNAQLTAPGAPGQLGEEMKLLFVVVQGGWQAAVKEKSLPAYQQGIAAMFKNQYGMDMTLFKLTATGFTARAGAASAGAAEPATRPAASSATTAPAAAPVAKAAAGAAPSSGAAAGAQWFFRAVSSGSGGVAFEPVVLLANGSYVDIGEEPLEGLNVAAAKAARPDAWGTWRKNGSAFVLTNARSGTNSYTLGSGNWFPAYAAGAAPLKQAYENVGGGNIGAATLLSIDKIQFVDDTLFRQGENMGVLSSNAAGGRTSSASGTYRLQGHTLTLTYADGRTVRKSFALGASGAPARPTNTLIFIGGDAYTDTK
ncbi:hypothetical protein [Hymenobacter sp.]|uniref:hypothetical protein n=1 Tax=Hymenobacter sp. TaxID=1898978 RepID=UPI00286BF2CC|nr:hypothetical protein [Hymenobacter sp.]